MSSKLLNNSNLAGISLSPPYDRALVTSGIVHFGVGGFHRSHQAKVIDDLLRTGGASSWGIVGVGLMANDYEMKQIMERQNCLYTLIETSNDGVEAVRIIGSIIDYLYAPDDPEKVLRLLSSPKTQIVSLTITEGGYNINPITGLFDIDSPVIQDELRTSDPKTVFAYVVKSLARRKEAGISPFTVMSCDNLPNNGDVTRTVFATYAREIDPSLGDWIYENVSFPNSMVDRITPAVSASTTRYLSNKFTYVDASPVVAETFFQWVLEDDFSGERPNFEEAGVELVADVEPYELMKLRILNGAHQALAYFAYLLGYRYVHDAIADSSLKRLVWLYMTEEAIPSLRPIEGVDFVDYAASVLERFSNAAVGDSIARLCEYTSDRIPKWLVPLIKEQLGFDEPRTKISAAVIASWARYAEGFDEEGNNIDIVDLKKNRIMSAVERHDEDLTSFLKDKELFQGLAEVPVFTDQYVTTLDLIRRKGARLAIEELLES